MTSWRSQRYRDSRPRYGNVFTTVHSHHMARERGDRRRTRQLSEISISCPPVSATCEERRTGCRDSSPLERGHFRRFRLSEVSLLSSRESMKADSNENMSTGHSWGLRIQPITRPATGANHRPWTPSGANAESQVNSSRSGAIRASNMEASSPCSMHMNILRCGRPPCQMSGSP